MTDFREIVKARLNERGLSIAALARQIGVSHETLYRWLRGDSQIGSDTLGRILAALQIRHLS